LFDVHGHEIKQLGVDELTDYLNSDSRSEATVGFGSKEREVLLFHFTGRSILFWNTKA
jgi:hypothetical protein